MMMMIHTCNRRTIAALALALATLGSAHSVAAQDVPCPGLSLADSNTLCPAGNAWVHRLEFVDWSGNSPNLTGDDVVRLGTYAGYLTACVNGSLHFVRDATANSYGAHLQADSAVCFGSGNDDVEVITSGSTASCGGVTLSGFAYNNYMLVLYGQTGHDRITGAHGADAICGGADNDHADGRAGTDILYGMSGGDRLFGGLGFDQVFGGSGSDRCFGGDYDGFNDVVFAESGNTECIQDAGATSTANASCHYSSGSIAEYWAGYSTAPSNCSAHLQLTTCLSI